MHEPYATVGCADCKDGQVTTDIRTPQHPLGHVVWVVEAVQTVKGLRLASPTPIRKNLAHSKPLVLL